MINRRKFLAATPLALAALGSIKNGFSAEPSPAAASGEAELAPPVIGRSLAVRPLSEIRPARIVPASPKQFKILQFTDLHFLFKTPDLDARTIADFGRHIELQRPDLVVVSGDMWHDNPEGRGKKGLEMALGAFPKFGVPWTVLWGNHDKLDDYQSAHDLFEKAENSVYTGGGAHGDHRIEVVLDKDAAQPGHLLDIYCLNSGAEGLTGWQVRSLGEMKSAVRKRSETPPPAFAFFHIPILEYETRLGPANFKGAKLEGVGHGKDTGAMFPVIKGDKPIRACFCGHNHTNDYVLETEGVDLVYGRSTGHAGYGGEKLRKGAKLIEIDCLTGKYQQTSVFADGSKNFA